MRVFIAAAVVLLAIGLTSSKTFAAETCGDGLDNDSDVRADEGCFSVEVTGVCESPVGCASTGFAAPVDGGLVYRLPADISVTTPYGPSLTFQRVYTSHYEPGGGAPTYRKPLGAHWQHNFMSWLEKNTTPNPDQVVLHTTSGNDVMFTFDSTAGGYDYYVAQAGYHIDYLRQDTTALDFELRTLTGDVFVYDWSSPIAKLSDIKDSVGNRVIIAYDGNGQVSTVTDASGAKRLLFTYTSDKISSIDYQTISGGTPTTRVTLGYSYTSGNLEAVTAGGTTFEDPVYTSNYLTAINDGAGKTIASFKYLSSGAGKVARTETGAGEVGYEYGSSARSCTTGAVIYFHRVGTTACDDDADCGSDYLCGGETDAAAANTGVCYQAARCATLTSPNDDLLDTVTAIPASTCTGTCLDNAEYDWDTGTGGAKLDLIGVKQPDGTWTSYQRNADGLPTIVARGDTDSNPTNANSGQLTWLVYGNTSFPGRVTESRRLSELKVGGSCSASVTTDCARTLYTWTSGGLLSTQQELGFTVDSSGATVSYSYTTTYSYDAQGRVTQVDGPLSGSNDVTDYTYWSSSDVLKNGYLKEIKRKKDTTNYVTTTLDSHDYWGQSTSQQDPDGTFTCRTRDSNRGTLLTVRDAMASQTSCATSDSTDLTTTYTYDTWLRLTKTQFPNGNCMHREHDSEGRLEKVKSRDDCTAGSSGHTIEYTYDTDGLLTKTEYKDASNTVTWRQETTYHDSRRRATDVNPVSSSYSRSYSYGTDGLLSTVTGENTLSKTEWLWDSLDRTDAVRRYKTASTYDTWDWSYRTQLPYPNKVQDDNTKAIEPTWDDLRRKVKVVSPDSGTTLYVHDAAGRVTTLVEADGTGGEVSHTFTYDNLDRMLTADYGSVSCGAGQGVEMTYGYDSSPVTCPTGATCTRQAGRLAYVKSTLLCNAGYADKTLDQEVFYAYDDAGRIVQEFLQDDSGRSAPQTYAWDKNRNNTEVVAPSGAKMQWDRNDTGENSDLDRIVTLKRYSGSAQNVTTLGKWMPFGPPSSYRHENTSGSQYIKAVLTWNLAYRLSGLVYEQITSGTDVFAIAYSEDVKGRHTLRDFTTAASGVQDGYFGYDWHDRLLCDSAASGSCPLSGANLKTNISTPYSASSDRVALKHRNSAYGEYTYDYTIASGKDQISSFATTPSTGTTSIFWDSRGNRTEDNSNSYTDDKREYFYEGRNLVRQISGRVKISGNWFSYTLVNAYDHKGRRVFKSYSANAAEAQWFFYYDLEDRLIEVKHTPNISSSGTYSLYQFYWIGDRPIAYWQTDYPSVTISRRYLHSDDTNRPLDAYSWPTTGDGARVWAINPDAFGWDEIVTGTTVYQPLRLTGQYYDAETTAWQTNGTTPHRPPLHLGRGYFDPLTASFLQVDRTAHEARSYEYGVEVPPAGEVRSYRSVSGIDVGALPPPGPQATFDTFREWCKDHCDKVWTWIWRECMDNIGAVIHCMNEADKKEEECQKSWGCWDGPKSFPLPDWFEGIISGRPSSSKRPRDFWSSPDASDSGRSRCWADVPTRHFSL